ncbi:MAG: FHA domain-containing protein [Paraglaciecola sp.]|nr:FHA domain-containing protein [Paraglaciecola sp.]
MAIVVELLSRKNLPIKHFKFDKNSITIGRDYHTDLHLDDPYVCPTHLVIEQNNDGELQLSDCQSVNGVMVNHKTVSQQVLGADDIIKIGRSRLRIIDPAKPVTAALVLSPLEEKLGWLNSSLLAILLTLAYLAYSLLTAYIGSVAEFKIAKALPQVLGQMAAISLWPLMLAALAKIFRKDSHLVSQFNLIWLLLLGVNALGLFQSILYFNFQFGSWYEWFEFFVFAAIVCGFIWITLFIGFHQASRRRNIYTVSLTSIVLAPILIFGMLENNDFSPRPEYDATILPPSYHFTSADTTEEFILHTADLFQAVDKLVTDKSNIPVVDVE